MLFYKTILMYYYFRMQWRYGQGVRNVIIDRCIQIVLIKLLTAFENCTMTTKFAKYCNINRIQQQTTTNFPIASKLVSHFYLYTKILLLMHFLWSYPIMHNEIIMNITWFREPLSPPIQPNLISDLPKFFNKTLVALIHNLVIL